LTHRADGEKYLGKGKAKIDQKKGGGEQFLGRGKKA